MKGIRTKEIMTRDVITARKDSLVAEVVALFQQHRLRALPVAGQRGEVVGIISEADVFLKEKTIPFSSERAPSLLGEIIDREDIDHFERARHAVVEDVMTADVITVGEDTPLEDLAMLMHLRHLNTVPVVKDGKLVGVVSRTEVLRVVYGATQPSSGTPAMAQASIRPIR